ncbi:MAG: helicase, partial [Chloroflexia bacterium]|nr:helicase [Chloroflexia bacterium]
DLRVIEVLVRKTETIKRELGSLSQVIDDALERRLRQGIRHHEVAALVRDLEQADLEAVRRQHVAEELDLARERAHDLHEQITRCQTLLDKSKRWTGFEDTAFRQALSCALEMLGAPPLQRTTDLHGQEAWLIPNLHERAAADPSWNATLDTLRVPRAATQNLTDWRREAPIRPVVFADAGVLTEATVHLHLEHRVAQRLLARFRAQGFTDDLSRACLFQSSDDLPRIVLFGRLALYGQGAERLHEELIAVTARWLDPSQRSGPLTPYGRDGEARTLQILDEALRQAGHQTPGSTTQRRLLATAATDLADLQPHLTPRAEQAAADAIAQLRRRGEREASDLRTTIVQQQQRVRAELERTQSAYVQLTLDYNAEEKRQFDLDRRTWEQRLVSFERDLATEPQRVQAFYEVRARRIEPVGLIYLWPETN